MTDLPSLQQRPSSLKQHLGVLGALTLVTLVLALALGIMVLRQTESAQVSRAGQLLDGAAEQLAGRYDYLQQSVQEHQKIGDFLQSENEGLLRSLTDASLAGVPGVEGGFYAADTKQFLGYAYPTYSGSGPKTDVPEAERSTIERVAIEAVARKERVDEQIAAGSDLLLFRAHPLLDHERPVGAAWVMYRLSGIRSGYQQTYAYGIIGLLIVSVSVAVGAWLVTRRLDRSVTKIESGLRVMEHRLDTPIPHTGVIELDRIGAATNRLAATLLDHQARRSELEHQLRQADRLAALGRLVAGVAHELRNPLASMKLKVQLLRRGRVDSDRLGGAFEIIEAEIAKMNRLIERLLTLAKPAQPSLLPTDLSRFLTERIDLWRARALAQGTALEYHPDLQGSEPVPVDRDRVGQIFDNLIANALEAVKDREGRIQVDITRARSDEIIMAVTDNGPGLPSHALEHLFEPFFTTRESGTGLGLFLSGEMAHAIGGDLRYCEHTEGGARFELRLPC